MNVFVGGQVVKTLVGALPKPKLVRELGDYLS
jgi:thioredoxin 1